MSAFREPRPAQALESVVYWELRRRGMAISYDLVGAGRHELDFVAGSAQNPPELAVQVCADLTDPATLVREERSLSKLVEADNGDLEPLILTLHNPPASMRTRFPVKQVWEWCLG